MDVRLKAEIEKKYNDLFEKYGLERPLDGKKIAAYVKEILEAFLKDKKKPAIYANGGHTKMLMADFMFELKNVKVIIDNYNQENESGFKQITDNEISEYEIDGIIISSYKFRKEIAAKLKEICPSIPVLDIYEEINKRGIKLNADYYYGTHPQQIYRTINKLKTKPDDKEKYRELISLFLQIKDIRLAIECCKKADCLYAEKLYQCLLEDIEELYSLMLEAYKKIDKKNVLLLCLDGMKRSDMNHQVMPRIMKIIDRKGLFYTNAYSYSTSTFESLMPVYSENFNMQTGYYKSNKVLGDECRFIKQAKEQKRKICLYTDMDKHIEDSLIKYSGAFQTLTQKLWDFMLDALETDNGLFLIHELYETHYSFSNPYTEGDVLFEGTAMLFDFLPQKGGKLRADYEKQHDDSMRYTDETLEIFLDNVDLNILMYADHGNLLLSKDTKLEDVPEIELTCSEGWTQVPFIVFGNNVKAGRNNQIVSLAEMNNVALSMEEGREIDIKKREYIKCARSEIYNPDFKYLYKKLGYEEDLLAFEAFVFENGDKIIIFSNGRKRAYEQDTEILDSHKIEELFSIVKDDITVVTR